MHEQDIAIVKALVPVAWADNVYADQERQMLEALLVAYEATDAEKKSVMAFAANRRTINDIQTQDLSSDDRRVLLQHAVILTFADGDQSADEVEFLTKLAEKLRIPEPEAKALMASAAERAKKHLHLL
jgi:uncharacterized tellurite resistance protein B-like protein